MRSPFIVFLLTIVLLLVGSCTGPTPYQKAEGQGGFGYSDYHVKDNIYHITFTGNVETDWEAVVDYFNRRAKDVCDGQGYPSFNILSDANIPSPIEMSDKKRLGGTYSQRYGMQWNSTVEQNRQVSGSVECLKKSQ